MPGPAVGGPEINIIIREPCRDTADSSKPIATLTAVPTKNEDYRILSSYEL